MFNLLEQIDYDQEIIKRAQMDDEDDTDDEEYICPGCGLPYSECEC